MKGPLSLIARPLKEKRQRPGTYEKRIYIQSLTSLKEYLIGYTPVDYGSYYTIS